jgi:hypothetical protein
LPAQRLVSAGITDEMIDYTAASVRESVARPAAGQASGFPVITAAMTNVIAVCVRHSLLRAQLPDYRR